MVVGYIIRLSRKRLNILLYSLKITTFQNPSCTTTIWSVVTLVSSTLHPWSDRSTGSSKYQFPFCHILNSCFDCRRRQAAVGQQKMAHLPDNRVTPSEPPFSYVGVDCFGPLDVCWGRSTVKWYGVLFTCLSIWAIHIEVAHSLDTDSFIDALRRCIAWRGQTLLMRSDNGGNFVKAKRVMWSCLRLESKQDSRLSSGKKHQVDIQSSCPVISWGCLGVMHSFCAEGDESSHEGRAFRWRGFADSNL